MHFSNLCRTCLGVKYLVPIFKDSGQNSIYAGTLFNLTGLQIKPHDGLPQQICRECVELINRTKQFKKAAVAAECKLIEYKNASEPVITLTIEPLKNENSNSDSDDEDETPWSESSSSNHIDIKIEKGEFATQEEKTTDNVGKKTILPIKEQATKTRLCLVKPGVKLRKSKIKLVSLKRVENTEESKVTCEFGSSELLPSNLHKHIEEQHPKEDKRWAMCELCSKYLMVRMMKNHVALVHENNFTSCFYCKKEFLKMHNLVKHVKICPKNKNRNTNNMPETPSRYEMIECDICHKTMQRGSLKNHTKIQHAGLGPVCQHCGLKLPNNFRLGEHCRAKHGYEKYKCSLCDFQASSAFGLKNHVKRRHIAEKPYVCDTCGAKFHASYLLLQHKRSHLTERDHKCKLCPSAFKTTNGLNMHKINCHSKKTFQCPMCALTFPSRSYTVKHLRKTHRFKGELPPLPPVTIETAG